MTLSRSIIACATLSCLLLAVGVTPAADCAKMRKELARLRMEYRNYAAKATPQAGEVKFETLAQMIDEIIELKTKMSKADCDVPSRLEDLGEKSPPERATGQGGTQGKTKDERRSNPKSR